ncbi:MAG: hypothetical protein KA801_07950 [Syntrophorhabdaceae bacterium]|nr:hypothetical protein [Syntrophorhabdaceae bacterium]
MFKKLALHERHPDGELQPKAEPEENPDECIEEYPVFSESEYKQHIEDDSENYIDNFVSGILAYRKDG